MIYFNPKTLRRYKKQAFLWMNATQFFGALNDNIFKALIQMFVIGKVVQNSEATPIPLAIATIAFALPYLFCTSYAGYLADRFSKKTVTVILKYAELVVMVFGLIAFAVGVNWMLYLLLFMMSVQSALFSPTKYSIVPELVKPEKLSRANSIIIACSFLAIIFGSFLAPLIAKGVTVWVKQINVAYFIAQLTCVVIAIAGILTSHRVLPLRSKQPGLHPDLLFPRKMWRTWLWVKNDRHLALAMFGTFLFSMVAAFMQINMIYYGLEHMGLNEKASTFLFFYAAVGIAIGALASGRLSKRNIEFGTMPGGALLFTIALLVVSTLSPGNHFIIVPICIFLIGMGAGLFVVPLDTFLQVRIPEDRRGEGLALNTFMAWSGILCSGITLWVFFKIGITAAGGFMIFSLPSMLLALISFFTLKDFAFRFIVTCVVRLLYRVRSSGIENIPLEGPALIIANHASYMDSLLLCATSRRRIRFLMSSEIYNKSKWKQKFYDLYGVIPVSSKLTPRELARSLRKARQAMDEGYLVCVFAEGGITRTATIRGFKRGYELINRGTDYPIIPVYLGGSWGTIYHYVHGKLQRRLKVTLRRYRVTVMFGKPLPANTDAFRVREAVMELSCDYFNARKAEHASMGKMFVRRARSNWNQPFMNDTTGMNVTSGKCLIASIALARAIGSRVKGHDYIGILLPSCCAGAIANFAVALLGRAAVNLNFTTAPKAFQSSIEQCKLNTIITSRKFVERFPHLGIDPEKSVFVEDLLTPLKKKLSVKLKCALLAKFAPFWMMTATKKTTADDIALVLFSSGSTGEPKGVMLSHHNSLSMLESLLMMLTLEPDDRICGTLPFFHSFGIMGCLWYPLLGNIKVSYHTSPLDAQIIADVVRENDCTLLFGTPTFLSVYLRKATKNDFKSLRFVLAGAEKLKESLANAYVEKYGLRPYEAYGATELAPGIAVSIPHGTGGGITQLGWRAGRAGILLPGIATRILDVETGEPVKPGEAGLLWLKGPNVMLGYLGRPDLTEEVLKDGWYCTGDVAFLDEDGFLGLTDRLSRFSKIGGEMVPHVGVEDALLTAAKLSGTVLAVSGVPDERKGEKLVVLYTEECGSAEALAGALDQADIPNLWKPALREYYRVETIPVLGTGKLDLSGVKKLAKELAN